MDRNWKQNYLVFITSIQPKPPWWPPFMALSRRVSSQTCIRCYRGCWARGHSCSRCGYRGRCGQSSNGWRSWRWSCETNWNDPWLSLLSNNTAQISKFVEERKLFVIIGRILLGLRKASNIHKRWKIELGHCFSSPRARKTLCVGGGGPTNAFVWMVLHFSLFSVQELRCRRINNWA